MLLAFTTSPEFTINQVRRWEDIKRVTECCFIRLSYKTIDNLNRFCRKRKINCNHSCPILLPFPVLLILAPAETASHLKVTIREEGRGDRKEGR